MELTTALAVGCFVCSVPQGTAAVVFLVDRFWSKNAEAQMVSTKGRSLFLAILLVVGTALTATFGGYLLGHPVKPTIVEKTVTVEKPVPCSPTTTGDASTHGAQSPANSGVQNTTTYGAQPAPPDKPKSDK
jgi:hypothetical protein